MWPWRQSRMGNCASVKQESVDTTESTVNSKGQCSRDNCMHSNKNNEAHISATHIEGSFNSSFPKSDSDPKNKATPANEDVIDVTRAEVNSLLELIHEFEGTTESDKDYRYLDEMLTRCILKLDTLECNNSTDRSNRKEAIQGVNQAIAILERKLAINSDINRLESNLSDR